MTKDEALKQALEALEGLFGIPDYWTSEGGGGVAVWRLGGSDAPRQAITAIREALEQPAPPKREWVGLTDAEATALWEAVHNDDSWELIKRVEAKLKEKNT